MLRTRFTETYELAHPIASAGMAFATLSPRLPVAVCEAGALGAFAAGPFRPDFIRANLRGIREQTDRPVNLNFITPFIRDGHLELCLEELPDVVSFHWQHPDARWIERLKDAGIDVWEQVGNAEAARRAVGDGVDLVVAQGLEAGGHCYGELPLFALVPAVVDAVGDALVLAAGGIVDGRGLAGALALGADGAMIGTRLIATPESDLADEYKKRIVAAGSGDTVLSSIFGRDMPDFNPMRLIRNRIVDEWHGRLDEIDAMTDEQPVIGSMPLGEKQIEMRRFVSLLPVAGASGDFEQMPLTAGQGLGGIHDIRPVREVIASMSAQAAEIFGAVRAG